MWKQDKPSLCFPHRCHRNSTEDQGELSKLLRQSLTHQNVMILSVMWVGALMDSILPSKPTGLANPCFLLFSPNSSSAFRLPPPHPQCEPLFLCVLQVDLHWGGILIRLPLSHQTKLLSLILLHKTRTQRTMLTNYVELRQDRKPREGGGLGGEAGGGRRGEEGGICDGMWNE